MYLSLKGRIDLFCDRTFSSYLERKCVWNCEMTKDIFVRVFLSLSFSSSIISIYSEELNFRFSPEPKYVLKILGIFSLFWFSVDLNVATVYRYESVLESVNHYGFFCSKPRKRADKTKPTWEKTIMYFFTDTFFSLCQGCKKS